MESQGERPPAESAIKDYIRDLRVPENRIDGVSESDWKSIYEQAVRGLQSALQIDTSNPPGNEDRLAEPVAEMLRRDGLEPEVLESAPRRANVVARVPGDGSAAPILLASHMDVIPAIPHQWSHPPFDGALREGYLWGRGAIDMKHFLMMSATVIGLLKRLRLPLRRDVIFAAVSDEEAGCDYGSRYLVDKHPEKVRAEYMLGEGGGFSVAIGELTIYPVAIAEKGVAWLRMKARGLPGHGAMPHDDNANAKLARAIAKLARARLPQHNVPVVERFLKRVASLQPGIRGAVMRGLLNPRLSTLILRRLMPDPELARPFFPMLGNTATPTVLRSASNNTNLIPEEASVELDGRTLPGQSSEDILRELREVVGDEVEFETIRDMPPVESADTESPLYRKIEEILARYAPGAVPVPTLIPGFTDAKQFHRLGAKCYGFAPVRFDPAHGVSFAKMFHGIDERVPVDGFCWGLRLLFDLVGEFAMEV